MRNFEIFLLLSENKRIRQTCFLGKSFNVLKNKYFKRYEICKLRTEENRQFFLE